MQHQFTLTPQHIPEELAWLCDILSMDQMLRIIDIAGKQSVEFASLAHLLHFTVPWQ